MDFRTMPIPYLLQLQQWLYPLSSCSLTSVRMSVLSFTFFPLLYKCLPLPFHISGSSTTLTAAKCHSRCILSVNDVINIKLLSIWHPYFKKSFHCVCCPIAWIPALMPFVAAIVFLVFGTIWGTKIPLCSNNPWSLPVQNQTTRFLPLQTGHEKKLLRQKHNSIRASSTMITRQ